MPTPIKYKAPFFPGGYYHMIFRSIDGLFIHQLQKEYGLFLEQFANYLRPVLDLLAYNLLENHSHFIVQVKEEESLFNSLGSVPLKYRTSAMAKFIQQPSNHNLVDVVVERQVNSLMTSYVKLKNFSTGRKGGIFQRPFRRSVITSDTHLQQAIIYVHANAQKHGIVQDYRHHTYSSYHEIVRGDSANVQISKILNFFGGKVGFLELHELQVGHFYADDVSELSSR